MPKPQRILHALKRATHADRQAMPPRNRHIQGIPQSLAGNPQLMRVQHLHVGPGTRASRHRISVFDKSIQLQMQRFADQAFQRISHVGPVLPHAPPCPQPRQGPGNIEHHRLGLPQRLLPFKQLLLQPFQSCFQPIALDLS